MSAYFVSLITLPTVIIEAGEYLTRSGERVIIEKVSSRSDLGCEGWYLSCCTPERWHKSGRIMASRETANDIVARL